MTGADPLGKIGLLAAWRLEGLWWDVKLQVKAFHDNNKPVTSV